jgi:uncharacterized protein YjbI with pentapeptide repeats
MSSTKVDRDTLLSWLRGGPDGIAKWNKWRGDEPGSHLDPSIAPAGGALVAQVDLSGADLCGFDLRGAGLWRTIFTDAKFKRARLEGVSFGDAILRGADFAGARMQGAKLGSADLLEAKLCRADLTGAFLQRASLLRADVRGATLERAHLEGASLVDVNLEEAKLTGCFVYGVSAWDLKLSGATQRDLIIRPSGDTNRITVDNLEVAQFINLLLRNEKIRDVIDTMTSKVVLLLGRFTPERKQVLDAMRNELGTRNYCPVMFDFEAPSSRSTVETIKLLAHMARFILADLTDPCSVPQELASIVPDLTSVPVKPVLAAGRKPWGMFEALTRYGWVLPLFTYRDPQHLLASVPDLIREADEKVAELRKVPRSK